MSRIMRTFYEFKDRVLSHELLEEVLIRYKKDLECSRARILVEFRYPIVQKSLRSGLEGWQYYKATLEGTIDDLDRLRRYVPLGWYWLGAYGIFRQASVLRIESASLLGSDIGTTFDPPANLTVIEMVIAAMPVFVLLLLM